MIGFIDTLFTHTTPSYRQYSAIAVLHTFQFNFARALGFSVFTSHILATDLSQSHRNFKSHRKPSSHSLISFMPLFCNCQLNSIHSLYSGRLSSWTQLYSVLLLLLGHVFRLCPFITPHHGPQNRAFNVKEVCLQLHYLAMDVLLLHVYNLQECV
jgi:hypothetical protein